jgi:N-acetylglucosamine PTS system EIICBA or EIICB component
MSERLALKNGEKRWLQTISEGLLPPATVLPLAGLLVMAGDLLARLGVSFAPLFAQAGFGLIGQMPLFIAIGLAYAMAAEQPGLAALSGALAALVLNQTGAALLDLLNKGREGYSAFNMGLLAGFIAGLTAGCLHNYCRGRSLPRWLGGFRLKPLVPGIAALSALAEGLCAGAIWTFVQRGMASLADRLPLLGAGGAFAYGFLNRLLMPLGLHHVLNDEIWLKYGDFTSQSGLLVTGDLNRLLAGDPTAGRYIAGFYPMLIFALPAVALVLILVAKPDRRLKLGIYLATAGLAAMISGVAEPLELLLLLTSPWLYVLLALLYGLSQLICFQLQVHAGFTFSTGLSDYLATWNLGSHPERIWQVGLVMAALVFGLFYLAIRVFRLPAPGRVREELVTHHIPLEENADEDIEGERAANISPEFVAEPVGELGETEPDVKQPEEEPAAIELPVPVTRIAAAGGTAAKEPQKRLGWPKRRAKAAKAKAEPKLASNQEPMPDDNDGNQKQKPDDSQESGHPSSQDPQP